MPRNWLVTKYTKQGPENIPGKSTSRTFFMVKKAKVIMKINFKLFWKHMIFNKKQLNVIKFLTAF